MWFNENAFSKTTTTKVDLVDCKSYQNIQLFAHKEIYSLTNNNKKHLQGKSIFLNVRKDNKHFQIALKQSNYKKHFCTEGIFWINFSLCMRILSKIWKEVLKFINNTLIVSALHATVDIVLLFWGVQIKLYAKIWLLCNQMYNRF